ncbi:MAG: alkaline phosphatase family protein [Acidobacteria bacterium]|nr:alkaline phosphatase family protein [Acidobacteriota bacterium]
MSCCNRRDFLKLGLAAGAMAAAGLESFTVVRAAGRRDAGRKMIILGFDGLDPDTLNALIGQGKLPAFARLRAQGGISRLGTALPPQSPVAWSNFITGTNPGGHGVYDFIHRNPKDYFPYLSTSKVEGGGRTIEIGDYVIPISGGKVELLRKGRAFWQILEDHDIPSTVVQIPSNFPPAATNQRTISGMGTPDIVLGGYGEYNFYTTEPMTARADVGGGKITLVRVVDNVVEAAITGPRNSFRKKRVNSSIPFKVFLDPEHPVAKIVIDNDEFILNEREWSSWKHVRFPMIPTQSVPGICRFYLKQVRPEFKLYVSPVHIDPAEPALPICTPDDYSRELADDVGPFFTKGLPADTNALQHGVLDEEEFLEQDDFNLQESVRLFEHELARFDGGLWFHYFSCTDQRQHMFYRLTDPKHPIYDPVLAEKFGRSIEMIYKEMDRVLALTMDKADKDTVIMVMSDHGFASFRRCFNLNTWLMENGYLRISNPFSQEDAEFHSNTDWSGTKAYALGINGLYVNLRGREGHGIVDAGAERAELVRELCTKLQEIVDPLTGEQVITKAYAATEAYQGPYAPEAPDIVMGYNRGYRASWATPLGRIPKPVFEDNLEKWSGDHCMDPDLIPGVLMCNRPIKSEKPALYDLTATILDEFGAEIPKEVIGKPIL